MATFIIILSAVIGLIISIILFSIYHKMFDVYYFGFEGCAKEIVVFILIWYGSYYFISGFLRSLFRVSIS